MKEFCCIADQPSFGLLLASNSNWHEWHPFGRSTRAQRGGRLLSRQLSQIPFCPSGLRDLHFLAVRHLACSLLRIRAFYWRSSSRGASQGSPCGIIGHRPAANSTTPILKMRALFTVFCPIHQATLRLGPIYRRRRLQFQVQFTSRALSPARQPTTSTPAPSLHPSASLPVLQV